MSTAPSQDVWRIIPGSQQLDFKAGAVAPVHRVVILDRRAILQIRDAVQRHQRRAPVDPSNLACDVVRGDGLNISAAAAEPKTALLLQEPVQGSIGQVDFRQRWAQVEWNEGVYQLQRSVVDKAEPVDVDDSGPGSDLQVASHLVRARHNAMMQVPACWIARRVRPCPDTNP